jgi:hypothetical protein
VTWTKTPDDSGDRDRRGWLGCRLYYQP